MRGKLATVTVLTTVLAACSSPGSPATTPAAVPTTDPIATTVSPVTTTTAATTTVDRAAEIEAIFQDLEERRLRALYDGDREAFRDLFANDEYLERSMALFDLVEFVDGWVVPEVTISAVLSDSKQCLAAVVESDYSSTTVGGDESSGTEVLESSAGEWGLSYAGEGWACDGPHPLSL